MRAYSRIRSGGVNLATAQKELLKQRPDGSTQLAPNGAVEVAAVRKQTERILADPLFQHSKRYGSLLKYIVDQTLEGKHHQLKERIIGIEVFGRTPDFDTSIDPSVRVTANEVRKRLALYYKEVEHDQELRIDVPVRSYIAEFKLPEPSAKETKPEPQAATQRQMLRPLYLYLWAPLVVVVLGLSIWGLYRALAPVPVIDRFWAPVVKSPGPSLIFIGAPSDAHELVKPAAHSPSPATQEDPVYDHEQMVNVGMRGASAAADLATYLRSKGRDSVIRPTQDTRLAESQSKPVILYGMFLNEMAAKLGVDLHYQFLKESDLGLRWIENTSNPASRAWSVDMSAPYVQMTSDYALITRVQDRTTGRWWIGIAGLTELGTFAANQVVTDPKAMSTIGAGLPADWDRKNLQIVLQFKVVQGGVGATQVVATNSW